MRNSSIGIYKTCNTILDVPGDQKSDKVMVEFEKAAAEMKGNETVVFSKFNVNLNDGEVGSNLEIPTLTLHFANSTRVRVNIFYINRVCLLTNFI